MSKQEQIKQKIFNIRGQNVILDKDISFFYRVETKNLNKVVTRNIELFPNDFMFKLNKEEFNDLRFQNGTSKRGGTRYFILCLNYLRFFYILRKDLSEAGVVHH